MSLEAAIKELTAAVVANTAAQGGKAAPVAAKPAAAKPSTPTPAAADSQPAAETPAGEVTYDEVKGIVNNYVKVNAAQMAAGKAVFAKHGLANMLPLKDNPDPVKLKAIKDDFDALVAALTPAA